MVSSVPASLDLAALRAVSAALRDLAGAGLETLNWALRVLLHVDALKMGVPTLLALHVWLRPRGGYRTDPLPALLGAAGVTLALAFSRVAQNLLPARLRPRAALADFPFPPLGHLAVLDHWGSFPSDHAALAFALTAVVWVGSRRLGLLAAAWSVVVVCLPRLYFGYHYLSDLLAGAALGVLSVVAMLHLPLPARLSERAGAWLRRLDARAPTLFLLGFIALGTECLHLFESTRRMAGAAGDLIQVLVAPTPHAATAMPDRLPGPLRPGPPML